MKLFHSIICFWTTHWAIAGAEAVTNSGINVLWNLTGVLPDSQLMSISLYNLDLRISWLNTWQLGSLPLIVVSDWHEVNVNARLVVSAFCVRLSSSSLYWTISSLRLSLLPCWKQSPRVTFERLMTKLEGKRNLKEAE